MEPAGDVRARHDVEQALVVGEPLADVGVEIDRHYCRHGHVHGPRPRPVELAEEDALPRAERELAVAKRHEHLRPHQRRARMRGRVLLALLDVLPPPRLRDELLERHLEVARDHRIGVLVDRQAGGRVRDVDEHGRRAARVAGPPRGPGP